VSGNTVFIIASDGVQLSTTCFGLRRGHRQVVSLK